MLDDSKAILYGFERKWLEALMINCQMWSILEIFLGIDGLSKFTFHVPVIKNNYVKISFSKGKWSSRKRKLQSLRNSEPNPGGQWKEIWGSQLSSRLEKQLFQLDLEVRKKVVFKKEVDVFLNKEYGKSEVVFSCKTLKQVTGDIQILFSASKALISWWCSPHL